MGTTLHDYSILFPQMSQSQFGLQIKQRKISNLATVSFGPLPAHTPHVNSALILINEIPEQGRLALIGLVLIVVASVLRRTVLRVQPTLDSPQKANVQAD
jgi:hypothetical protein